jgi:beta-lysine 5,6-aminomutase beta subunit
VIGKNGFRVIARQLPMTGHQSATYMLKVNLKKLKPYGDRLDDGAVQLSFTFPVAASPEAREAARRYVEELGLTKVSIAAMEPMGERFTFFVAYGVAQHTIDLTKVRVPKVQVPQMDFAALKEHMARHLSQPIVVVGAATGSDAHTVGIDAIMNMKGFAGDYGLERYPLFRAVNLRSQLSNEQLIEKAIELDADVLLISQVVTQRDVHVKNLKTLQSLLHKEKRLRKELVTIVGGPRIDHALAVNLGFDAGFGSGTKPSQVASFIVQEYLRRQGIAEKPEAPAKRPLPKQEPEVAPQHSKVSHGRPSARVVKGHVPAETVHKKAEEPEEELSVQTARPSAEGASASKKRRRRGRRGGRRHRRRTDQAPGTNGEPTE